MPPPPHLTHQEWKAIYRDLAKAAYKLTKNVAKAKELVQAAVAKSIEPTTTPWDRETSSFEHYLYNLLWSLHGNEIQSYRVVMASYSLDAPEAVAAAHYKNPERLLLGDEETARAARLYAALDRRIQDDPLIVILLGDDDGSDEDEASSDAPGDEMRAPDPDAPAAAEPTPTKKPRTQPASTLRALRAGYSHTEIKHARERLKRHALAVVRAEKETQ